MSLCIFLGKSAWLGLPISACECPGALMTPFILISAASVEVWCNVNAANPKLGPFMNITGQFYQHECTFGFTRGFVVVSQYVVR